MKCPDNVMVTFRLMPGGRELDMEIPSFLPLDALAERLLETLRGMNPAGFGTTTGIRLLRGGEKLEGIYTPASLGLWDGTILEAILEGGERA